MTDESQGQSPPDDADSGTDTSGDESQDTPSTDDPGSGTDTSADQPTDAATEQAQVAQMNQSGAESLAAAIASYHGISSGYGSDTVDTSSSDPQAMAGGDVRAKCGPKGCDFSVTSEDGEVFALVDCGDGTCPTCPPGLGNLVVKQWCAYVGVSSQRSAIVLILVFGAKLGPFIV